MSSNIGSEGRYAVQRLITSSAQTYSLGNRQHPSGSVHQQKKGHALPYSYRTSTRVVSSSLGSKSYSDSSAYSGHSKCGSRHSLQTDRDQNRMDIGQGDLPVHLSEILGTRSGPFCIPLKPPTTQVCLEVPRSGGPGCECIPPGLKQMDLPHPPLLHSYIANTDLGYTASLERERSLPGDLHREPLDCGRGEVAH